MNAVDILSEKVEELQEKIHKMKKETVNDEHHLYPGEFALIKFIVKYNEEHKINPTLVIVSNTVGVSQATVTTIADRLTKKGLITKETSVSDKRAKYVALTEKGREFLKFNRVRYTDSIRALAEALGEEDVNTLIALLEKINKHI